MRQLFLFTNTIGNGQTGWEDCMSMADDGKVLGCHICSHWGFMYQDLVARPDRTADIKKHFNCEELRTIDIRVLKPGEIPPAEVLEKNTARRIAAEKLKKEQGK